jgi:hypothetical protein
MSKYLASLGVVLVAALALAPATMAGWTCISGCVPAPDPAPPPCYGGWCCIHGC